MKHKQNNDGFFSKNENYYLTGNFMRIFILVIFVILSSLNIVKAIDVEKYDDEHEKIYRFSLSLISKTWDITKEVEKSPYYYSNFRKNSNYSSLPIATSDSTFTCSCTEFNSVNRYNENCTISSNHFEFEVVDIDTNFIYEYFTVNIDDYRIGTTSIRWVKLHNKWYLYSIWRDDCSDYRTINPHISYFDDIKRLSINSNYSLTHNILDNLNANTYEYYNHIDTIDNSLKSIIKQLTIKYKLISFRICDTSDFENATIPDIRRTVCVYFKLSSSEILKMIILQKDTILEKINSIEDLNKINNYQAFVYEIKINEIYQDLLYLYYRELSTNKNNLNIFHYLKWYVGNYDAELINKYYGHVLKKAELIFSESNKIDNDIFIKMKEYLKDNLENK